MTIPELFRQHSMKRAYIGEFRIALAKNGQTLWVNHRFVREPNAFGTESGIFIGTIWPDGSFKPAIPAYAAKVQRILVGVASEGAEFLDREGKQLGECCYCGKQLEDPESVAYGYGPVCAKRHGRPHTNRHGF